MRQDPQRRRDTREFFGFERELWEDRREGVLARRLIERLAEAERELASATAQPARPGQAGPDDIRALLDAVRVARTVLAAARDAVREREAPVFVPRA